MLIINADKIRAEYAKQEEALEENQAARENIKNGLTAEYIILDDFIPEQTLHDNQIAMPDIRPSVTQAQFDYLLSKEIEEFEISQIQKAWAENRGNIKPVQMPFSCI